MLHMLPMASGQQQATWLSRDFATIGWYLAKSTGSLIPHMAEDAEDTPEGAASAPDASTARIPHTIIEAIQQVLRASRQPMTVVDTYESIVREGLYQFRAADPAHIVRAQIRRHCVGLDFPYRRREQSYSRWSVAGPMDCSVFQFGEPSVQLNQEPHVRATVYTSAVDLACEE
jgi:hypothetical protein